MRITELTSRPRTARLRMPFVTSIRTVTEVAAVEVTVHTDDGPVGRGEAVATPAITGETIGSIEAAVAGPLRAAVVGGRLADFEELLRRLPAALVGNRSAKAGVDIALHDLRARALGLPLHRLLGGAGSALTDVTVGVDQPAAMAEQAAARVAEGFGTLKLKVGVDPDLDVARVRAVRAAVGPDVALRVDANQAWTAKQAVRIVGELAEADLELVEQPVPAADLAGLGWVTERVAVPVMADESVATPADALAVIQRRAADLINIKLMKAGGLRPARQLADVAAAAGVGVMVGGMMSTALGVAADAALAGTLPAEVVHDLDPAWWLAQPGDLVRYERDRVVLEERPGLGGGNVRASGAESG